MYRVLKLNESSKLTEANIDDELQDELDNEVEVQIITGKTGNFAIGYVVEDKLIASLDINIDSL